MNLVYELTNLESKSHTFYLSYFHALKYNLQGLTSNVQDLRLKTVRDWTHLLERHFHIAIQKHPHVQLPVHTQHSGQNIKLIN